MEGTERLVNCRNGQAADRPLSEEAITVRASAALAEDALREEAARREAALARLRECLGDEAVANLLIVLGVA